MDKLVSFMGHAEEDGEFELLNASERCLPMVTFRIDRLNKEFLTPYELLSGSIRMTRLARRYPHMLTVRVILVMQRFTLPLLMNPEPERLSVL